ncbi:MAG: hypothetical protein L6R42_007201 [Xanthoria sp. 1 TBL-2021]|nr:MAG: hypothetical protein L6R42_007201 [Xanthoria sp. 1 TBL-2021]
MPSSQPSEYVTLISNDGFEFVILREAACVAGTIKRMIYMETSTGEMRRKNSSEKKTATDIPSSGVIVEKLTEYLYYNLKHRDSKDVPDMEIPPALCLELLVAADYFDV